MGYTKPNLRDWKNILDYLFYDPFAIANPSWKRCTLRKNNKLVHN